MHFNFMDPRIRGNDKTWVMSFLWTQDSVHSPNVIPLETEDSAYDYNIIPVETGIYNIRYSYAFQPSGSPHARG